LPEVANGKTSAAGKGDGREEEGKIKHKSLKSQPGANKKKEKLVAMEMERFAKNMALMSAGSAKMDSFRNGAGDGQDVVGLEGGRKVEGVKGGTADRWAAVRGLISQTMERRVDGEGGVGN